MGDFGLFWGRRKHYDLENDGFALQGVSVYGRTFLQPNIISNIALLSITILLNFLESEAE